MTTDATSGLRLTIYWLIGIASVAMAFGRLCGAENLYEPSRYAPPAAESYGAGRPRAVTPARVWPTVRPEPTLMFSSNDRSRWATVKALVENRTYVVGTRTKIASEPGYVDEGVIFGEGYKSLDKVLNPATLEFYSSKPPLLPTMVAGGYYVLHEYVGWRIDRERWQVVVTLLVFVNLLPFALYLACVAHLAEVHGTTDFGRVATVVLAAFGTLVMPFLVTFSNHVPATCCVMFGVWTLLRRGATGSAAEGFCAGLMLGFAAAFELPALAVGGAVFGVLALARPAVAVAGFAPGLVLPVAALLACNHQALGTLWPAYSEFGGPWYEYAGSEWAKIRATADPTGKGLDYAREPKDTYAFHLSFGHHGFFSLTPAWLVAAGGLGVLERGAPAQWKKAWSSRANTSGVVMTPSSLAAITVVVSAIVFGFYVWRTANYGGSTSGPRWLMWLTALWLLPFLAAADRLGRSRAGRVIVGAALAASVFSAAYPVANPWRNPWLMQLGETRGWFSY